VGEAVNNLGFAAITGRWRTLGAAALCIVLAVVALTIGFYPAPHAAQAQLPPDATHLGVASCSGSTCHGRSQADGKTVRQDEILRWQEPSSPTGAHSRAYAVLTQPRGREIARRIGYSSATAPAAGCIGCHSDNAASRGPRFVQNEGVGCESCHGGAQNWIDVHKSGDHAASLRAGMRRLDDAGVRAQVCVDCHFGSTKPASFVTHRMMAAGHPRISFELDLFTTLQQHHNEDADYYSAKSTRVANGRGKQRNIGVRSWAIGQAVALERSLSLFENPQLGTEGAFPEFYFFDCHSCHRRIVDERQFRQTVVDNPSRPIPVGMPPYNDENLIMLAAAARAVAPSLAARFDEDSKAFHRGIAGNRGAAVAAAAKLRASAGQLASAFRNAEFSRAQIFAIVDSIGSEAIQPRYTDYEGCVQAVMATDTLLNWLVNSGQVPGGAATGIRTEINRAYAAVRDPNEFRPLEFRRALGNAIRTIRTLR